MVRPVAGVDSFLAHRSWTRVAPTTCCRCCEATRGLLEKPARSKPGLKFLLSLRDPDNKLSGPPGKLSGPPGGKLPLPVGEGQGEGRPGSAGPTSRFGRCPRRLNTYCRLPPAPCRLHRGFTLVEILVAMAVTLILLGIVVTIFGIVGDNVSNSRATIEMTDQLRAAKHKLQLDLQGATTQMLPPRRPEWGEGYFEIIEGPVGRLPANTKWVASDTYDSTQLPTAPVNAASTKPDTTVGDSDDILMFTTRSRAEPFVGRFYLQTQTNPDAWTDTTLQSQVAEVAWFVRGTTLYRRQLLVRPDLDYRAIPDVGKSKIVQQNVVPQPSSTSAPYYTTPRYPQAFAFYSKCDLSVHAEGQVSGGLSYDLSPSPPGFQVIANSLEDLTKRECRFAHQPVLAAVAKTYGWPHDLRGWGAFYSTTPYASCTTPFFTPPNTYGTINNYPAGTPSVGRLGLPTLRECSSLNWLFLPGTIDLITHQIYLGDKSGNGMSNWGNSQLAEEFDAWDAPFPAWYAKDAASGTITTADPLTGTLSNYFPDWAGSRFGDDVILTNVLSFDVRVWDPTAWVIADGSGNLYVPGDPGYPAAAVTYAQSGAVTLVSQGAYVDLYYGGSIAYYMAINNISLSGPQQTQLANLASSFYGPGNLYSGLGAYDSTPTAQPYLPTTYDTGSWHYEEDGIDQNKDGITDSGTNGIDDNGNGLVDEVIDASGKTELEVPPPYAVPLRGVQIKIRCFEPDSKQIREVTIVQEFVPE